MQCRCDPKWRPHGSDNIVWRGRHRPPRNSQPAPGAEGHEGLLRSPPPGSRETFGYTPRPGAVRTQGLRPSGPAGRAPPALNLLLEEAHGQPFERPCVVRSEGAAQTPGPAAWLRGKWRGVGLAGSPLPCRRPLPGAPQPPGASAGSGRCVLAVLPCPPCLGKPPGSAGARGPKAQRARCGPSAAPRPEPCSVSPTPRNAGRADPLLDPEGLKLLARPGLGFLGAALEAAAPGVLSAGKEGI